MIKLRQFWLTTKVSDFRSEIAGLRAVAVICVVLFHLRVDGFQGGFVGVDVFFVISGYLITRNILADLRADRFSFSQFYIRRMRRIYPALIFTVAATYIAGALWCAPLMFLDLAKECTHALLSIANIQYWRESHKYFAPSSDELALLHFWSLSLEEQFYLVWPVFIVLAHKVKRTFESIAIAALVSFVGAIIIARSDPSAAFFLMPFRIFEFGVGAIVLLFEKRFHLARPIAEILSAAGIICILSSAFALNSDMHHLEIATLAPCLGTAATIWAGSTPRMSKLIANPAMVGIGAISYSLYLCHWPIIFFVRFIFGEDANSVVALLVSTAAMIAVASGMYFLIERRFIQPHGYRSANFVKNATVFGAIIVPLVAITHLTFLSKGFAWRLPRAQPELEHLLDFPGARDRVDVDGPIRFQLVGDSFASQYIAGLSLLAERLQIRFEVLGGAGCPILYGVELKAAHRWECSQARDQGLRRLSETTLPIILAQNWELYDDAKIDEEFDPAHIDVSGIRSFTKLQSALERTLEKLVANDRRILIVGAQVDASCSIDRPRLLQGPLPHAPPPPCPPTSRELAEQAGARANQMLALVRAKWPNSIRIFFPVEYFCDEQCPVVKDGVWLYVNRNHFSVAGSRYVVARAEDVFRKFLDQ